MPIAVENVHATIGEFSRNYLYMFFMETVPTVISTAIPKAINFSAEIDTFNTKAIFPDRKTNNEKISWGGEFFYIPTTDNSSRLENFEFFDDENQLAWDVFSALKDITGNEYNQAGVVGSGQKFNLGVAQVSLDKETIISYRRLIGCKVYELSKSEISKDGSSIMKITTQIGWDKNIEDKGKRGTKI